MLLNYKRGARIRKSRGQSLVEFALILPILLLLILGAMDIGRIITTKIAVTNAAREGANFLSRNALPDLNISSIIYTTGTPLSDATCDVITYEGKMADGSIVNVTIECDEITVDNCCTRTSPVTVTVSKEVELTFGDILEFLGSISGPLEIASSVQMRVK
jgi:Flp pilus assembly protein TadG